LFIYVSTKKYFIMAKTVYYTKEGLEKLQQELRHLETVKRPEISAQIAEARDKGDLSENAEYDAAKEAQGMLEMEIAKLQEIIRSARIIDESKLDNKKVFLLTKVKIKNLANNQSMQYQIVPEKEANIKEKKLSVDSPIAKGLLGKEIGEKAEIEVPSGKITFEIVEISR